MEQIDRFFAKVIPEPNSGCWIWTGSSMPCGYGSMHFEGRMQLAHRASYQMFVGPIPRGLQIDHLCRTRICCNPSHLEPVTQSENLKRSPLMDRNSMRTHCVNGHEFSASNTIRRSDGRRQCRECARQRTRTWRASNAKTA